MAWCSKPSITTVECLERKKKSIMWWTGSLLGSFVLLCICRLILNDILSPFDWRPGQKIPCKAGENWRSFVFRALQTTLVPLSWCRPSPSHQEAKPDLLGVSLVVLIWKPGVVVKLNDEVTLALVSLQLLLLLAGPSNSYLGRKEGLEWWGERVDKSRGFLDLVLPRRSTMVGWLLFCAGCAGEKEWAGFSSRSLRNLLDFVLTSW